MAYPAIGHLKNESQLRRNWLKGGLGDALNALLGGAGHNLRMILRAIRPFYARILCFWIISMKPTNPQKPPLERPLKWLVQD